MTTPSLPTMHHIDYGLDALDASVLAHWTVPVFDLGDVWSGLAAYSLLAGFETSDASTKSALCPDSAKPNGGRRSPRVRRILSFARSSGPPRNEHAVV